MEAECCSTKVSITGMGKTNLGQHTSASLSRECIFSIPQSQILSCLQIIRYPGKKLNQWMSSVLSRQKFLH